MTYQEFSKLRIVAFMFVMVFAATITSSAATLNTITAFDWTNGAAPGAGLVLDPAGNLYGTTPSGGANGYGTVFEISPAGGGWTETVLYSFCESTCPQGSSPQGALIIDSAGNLYGTTAGGGAHGSGTVFELSPATNGTWTESVLYSFCALTNCADGANPRAALIFGPNGELYSTTLRGGTSGCYGTGCGVVFELSRGSDGQWNEGVLHAFSGGDDGASPIAGVIADGSGNLYGTTWLGGAQSAGVAFELSPDFGAWRESVLHTFCDSASCRGGAYPWAGLTFGSDGSLYGTTTAGGKQTIEVGIGYGVVFRLAQTAGVWEETVLLAFSGSNGQAPYGGVIFDSNGDLFGTATLGGECCGVAFELVPGSGSKWNESILHVFQGGNDGNGPYGTLVMDAAGHLYGTTEYGGANGLGTVFQLK
jgi:uncharacterized repeat protein (TIGR03803 family)